MFGFESKIHLSYWKKERNKETKKERKKERKKD
jgi:hypothetical protein